MKLFLTSAIGATVKRNGKRCTGKIDNRYGFLNLFQSCLKRTQRMVYLSAIYDDQERIDAYFRTTIEALQMEGISFYENILINGEVPDGLDTLLNEADVIFLAGGHLPTQNKFFADIQLRWILQSYQGMIVAQSAGSMNCADRVYVCPEIPGEALDPQFKRIRPGLGLTDLNIIPHYDKNRMMMLDGLKFYEEIIAPDTYLRPLYLLTDGSFFYIDDGNEPRPYGDIWHFYAGKIKKICTSHSN